MRAPLALVIFSAVVPSCLLGSQASRLLGFSDLPCFSDWATVEWINAHMHFAVLLCSLYGREHDHHQFLKHPLCQHR